MNVIEQFKYRGKRVRNKNTLSVVSLITIILTFVVFAVGFTPEESHPAEKINFNHTYTPGYNQVKMTNSTVTPVGVNFTIKADSGHSVFGGRPGISFDGNNFFVVWREPSSNIYGARISQEGDVLDSPEILIAAGNGTPSVIFDGTNHLVIWVTDGKIYGARVTPGGIVVDSNPIQITNVNNAKVKPITLAFDGTNYLIAWRTTGDQIYGIRVSTSLVALDNPGGFSIGSGFYPWVAFDGTNYMLTWHK